MSQRQQGPPRPPQQRSLPEFPPVIEPRLRDMPGFSGAEIEGGFKPVKSTPIEGQSWVEPLARAQEAALADKRVRERLKGHRFIALGVSVLQDGKEESGSMPAVALFYDYDSNATLEVALTASDRNLSVVSVTESDYQPAPSDEEIERAIALAREDSRVAARFAEDLVPMPILTSAVEPGDRHHGTRRMVVGFGRPDERLPRVQALVDLGSERVLGVGVDLRHGAAEAEGFAETEEGEGGDK